MSFSGSHPLAPLDLCTIGCREPFLERLVAPYISRALYRAAIFIIGSFYIRLLYSGALYIEALCIGHLHIGTTKVVVGLLRSERI